MINPPSTIFVPELVRTNVYQQYPNAVYNLSEPIIASETFLVVTTVLVSRKFM
jgi:hypothetical protein